MKHLTLGLALAGVGACAWATEPSNDCVVNAAKYHQVNDGVLRAILWNESRMNAKAINRNANGTIDVGIAQINSMHFADLGRRGVTPQMLYQPCVGTYVAAWHLSRQLAELGNTWQGIGAYHSRTPYFNQSYANGVATTMAGWGLLPKNYLPFPSAPRSSAEAQRLKRSMATSAPVQATSQVSAAQPGRDPLVALSGS